MFLWKKRAWLHNRLIQKPDRNIRIMSCIIVFFLIYGWITTSFYVQFPAKFPFSLRSSFPLELKCSSSSSCKENTFTIRIGSSKTDATKKIATLYVSITSDNETDMSLKSSLNIPDNGPIYGTPSICGTNCHFLPKEPGDLQITYYPITPGVSYTLNITITIPPDGAGYPSYIIFDSTIITFT